MGHSVGIAGGTKFSGDPNSEQEATPSTNETPTNPLLGNFLGSYLPRSHQLGNGQELHHWGSYCAPNWMIGALRAWSYEQYCREIQQQFLLGKPR
jgi:hypothetical protein